MNINFVRVNIPPVEENVTLHSFLMLQVKARSRHASSLKTKETSRFSTPANLPHYQFLFFQRTRLRQLSVSNRLLYIMLAFFRAFQGGKSIGHYSRILVGFSQEINFSEKIRQKLTFFRSPCPMSSCFFKQNED